MAATIAGWQAESPIRPAGTTKVATDDWPYIYLESPRVPSLHFLLAGLLALIVAHGARKVGLSGPVGIGDASNWHFFFLGAAFLLLEVQNISKASVVLGNTWQVNAVVISGILAMVLLANLIVATCPRLPTLAAYAALGLICVGLYAADLSRLAFLPIAAKAPAVAVLAGLPMLFSGIIFARSFAASVAKDRALGANILGALVGGLLQPITFVTGTRFLLLIVAGFYAAAFLTRRSRSRSPAPTPSPVAPAGGPHLKSILEGAGQPA